MKEVHIRAACPDDCRLFWEWANDPETRRASFSTGSIPWESHVAWFAARLEDPDYRMYVAFTPPATPVALVRFAITGAEAVVSVTVAACRRGKGYGAAAVRTACAALFASSDVSRVQAYIKPDNEASTRAFLKAGFTDHGTVSVKGQRALRMCLECPG